MEAGSYSKRDSSRLGLIVSLWVMIGLAGCAAWSPTETPSEPHPDASNVHNTKDQPSEPDTQAERPDDLHYNLSKLDDPEFTQIYGDGENTKIWYTAAENLGSIGKPAIPHLIAKLDSANEHEVMLALYALQLASQDPALQQQTDGNYIALPSVLNPRANQHNKAIALSWWEQYQHLWNAH